MARDLGVHGYLSKALSARELVAALEAVHAGESVVSPSPTKARSQQRGLARPRRGPDRPRGGDPRPHHPGQEQRRGRGPDLPEPQHGEVLHPRALPQDRRRQPDPGRALGRAQRVPARPPPDRALARRPLTARRSPPEFVAPLLCADDVRDEQLSSTHRRRGRHRGPGVVPDGGLLEPGQLRGRAVRPLGVRHHRDRGQGGGERARTAGRRSGRGTSAGRGAGGGEARGQAGGAAGPEGGRPPGAARAARRTPGQPAGRPSVGQLLRRRRPGVGPLLVGVGRDPRACSARSSCNHARSGSASGSGTARSRARSATTSPTPRTATRTPWSSWRRSG